MHRDLFVDPEIYRGLSLESSHKYPLSQTDLQTQTCDFCYISVSKNGSNLQEGVCLTENHCCKLGVKHRGRSRAAWKQQKTFYHPIWAKRNSEPTLTPAALLQKCFLLNAYFTRTSFSQQTKATWIEVKVRILKWVYCNNFELVDSLEYIYKWYTVK